MGQSEELNNLLEQHAALVMLVKSRLSPKRFTHSLGVATTSWDLAKLYQADEEQAFIAGLCHDITKEESEISQGQLLAKSSFSQDRSILHNPELWHSVTGAVKLDQLAPDYPEITPEIISACLYHTIARPNMSKLEAIVFLADLIEPNRNWVGVDDLRLLARQSLNQGVAAALKRTIDYLSQKQKEIHANALAAYDFYKNLD